MAQKYRTIKHSNSQLLSKLEEERMRNDVLTQRINDLIKKDELYQTRLSEKDSQIVYLEQEVHNLKAASQQSIRTAKLDDSSEIKSLKAQLHLKNAQIANLEKELEQLRANAGNQTSSNYVSLRLAERALSDIPEYEDQDIIGENIIYDDNETKPNSPDSFLL